MKIVDRHSADFSPADMKCDYEEQSDCENSSEVLQGIFKSSIKMI